MQVCTMDESVIQYLKQYGVGSRHPRDLFFKDGDEICEAIKTFGVVEVDDEDFLHSPCQTFSCHMPGCTLSFETVFQYDQHYNSCHRFSCSQCGKNLPSSHLLDLHLAEVHDAFFAAQAERKPMFQCYLEECSEVFKNPQARRDHCISLHKFPSDFRFDDARKQKKEKMRKKTVTKPSDMTFIETDTGIPEENCIKMEVSEKANSDNSTSKATSSEKSFHFNNPRGRRKPVLYNFSKELMESLPK